MLRQNCSDFQLEKETGREAFSKAEGRLSVEKVLERPVLAGL